MMPSKPSCSSNWARMVKPNPVAYIWAITAKWSVGRAMRSTAPGCIIQPHLRHVITVRTRDVLQDTFLEMLWDSIPEDLGGRGEWWLHRLETFGMMCSLRGYSPQSLPIIPEPPTVIFDELFVRPFFFHFLNRC